MGTSQANVYFRGQPQGYKMPPIKNERSVHSAVASESTMYVPQAFGNNIFAMPQHPYGGNMSATTQKQPLGSHQMAKMQGGSSGFHVIMGNGLQGIPDTSQLISIPNQSGFKRMR